MNIDDICTFETNVTSRPVAVHLIKHRPVLGLESTDFLRIVEKSRRFSDIVCYPSQLKKDDLNFKQNIGGCHFTLNRTKHRTGAVIF